MAKNHGRGGVRTVWEKNSPDPLVDLAARCVLAHPECLFAIGRDVDDDEPKEEDVFNGRELSSNPSTSSVGSATASADLQVESTAPLSSTGSTVKLSVETVLDRGGGAIPPADNSARRKSTDRDESRRFVLREGLRLPAEICETLFAIIHEEGLDLEDNFAIAFSNPGKSRIKSVDLSGSSLTDRGFEALAGHNLRVLNVSNCRYLTIESLEALNRHSDSLIDLNIGNSVRFLPEYVCSRMDEDQVQCSTFYILGGDSAYRNSSLY